MNAQETVLSWAYSASRAERLDFLKAYLDAIKDEEVKAVKCIFSNARKRKLRKSKRVAPVCVKSSPESTGSLPWWKAGYKTKDIVSLDVEMVSLHEKDPDTNKHIVKAATVAIVNFKKEIIYQAKIQHKPNSFKVNPDTLRLNGFTSTSLKDGMDFGQVQKEVGDILETKLTIVCGGVSDFRALDLPMSDFDIFDITTYWKKFYGQRTKLGKKILQPIGLRSLYFHYYNIDLHSGIHDAAKDATATIDLFQTYRQLNVEGRLDRMSVGPSEEMQSIKTIK